MGKAVRQRELSFGESDIKEYLEREMLKNELFIEQKSYCNKPGELNSVESHMGRVVRSMCKPTTTIQECDDMGSEVCGGGKKPREKGKATAGQLMGLLQKQQYRCALTGRPLSPSTTHLDHIIPVSKGGSNEVGNLQWLEDSVNVAKSTMSQEQFIQLCRDVVNWVDRQRDDSSLPPGGLNDLLSD